MSQFFSQAEYAEDQPNAYTILTTHVLYRGFQSGAVIGIAIGLFRSRRLFTGAFRSQSRHAAQSPSANASAGFASRSSGQITRNILSATARSGVVGLALMGPAVWGRMRGRDEIEWKDRSWRLLANEGQMEVDRFSVLATAAGAPAAILLSGRTGLSVALVGLGGAGLGTVAGVASYMVYRYAIHRGKR